MRKNLAIPRKVAILIKILIASILAIGLVLIQPIISRASGLNKEVKLLIADGIHQVPYWAEGEQFMGEPQRVKIQPSSDGGDTWSGV